MQDENYDVYVDTVILGMHDPNMTKNALVAYVVRGVKELKRVEKVDAKETDDAEYEAILFAIHELKSRLKRFTIICDHQSVVSEANKDSKDTPSSNPLLSEIRKQLADSDSNITLKWFEKNPAHTLLNEYLIDKEKN